MFWHIGVRDNSSFYNLDYFFVFYFETLCEVTYLQWPFILWIYNLPLLSCDTKESVLSLIQHHYLLLFSYFTIGENGGVSRILSRYKQNYLSLLNVYSL